MKTSLNRAVFLLSLTVLFLFGAVDVQNAIAAPIRISCVGDSITYGAGVPNPRTQAWPVVLGRILGSRYLTGNFGVNDTTMLKKGDFSYWNQLKYKKAIAFHPNIVVIMLGTNDTKPWNWNKHGKDFVANAEDMIHVFKALPTHPRVYICLPPKALKATYGINEKNLVHGVIPSIRKVARATHTVIINVFRGLPGKMKYYIKDGIHPNIQGEAIIAHVIAKAIRR